MTSISKFGKVPDAVAAIMADIYIANKWQEVGHHCPDLLVEVNS
jgi:hypothetical protein